MDRVFRSEEQPFISEVIAVDEFLASAMHARTRTQPACSSSTAPSAEVDDDEDVDERVQQFAAFAGVSDEVGHELAALCLPESLKCNDGIEADDRDPFVTQIPDVPLVTLQIRKQEVQKRAQNPTYKAVGMRTLKYDRVDYKALNDNRNTVIPKAYTPPDVILTITVMKPYNRPLDHHEVRLGRLLKADARFLVRGQQELSVLRDRIPCASDYALHKDVSENPQSIHPTDFSRDLHPSNFLFFHDTFYVDSRKEKSTDLSEGVREWARRRSKEIGPFRVADMARTRFSDLRLRMGQPYLYLHQGSCEHLIVVSDIRLMDVEDNQDVSAYPLSILQKYKKRTACYGCKMYTAKWVTYGNERLPCDPTFFCEECFRSFNYASGEKIGSFKAVPFFDRTALST
uniref:snRNA-activating protein complex subunit 3 n=1 Tax=Plectus sambesii TaxID=2011161 RepID=A0A914WDT0_9BILA